LTPLTQNKLITKQNNKILLLNLTDGPNTNQLRKFNVGYLYHTCSVYKSKTKPFILHAIL